MAASLSSLFFARVTEAHVQEWRSSFNRRPPPLTAHDEHWPGRERKYADLQLDQQPLTDGWKSQRLHGANEPTLGETPSVQTTEDAMVVAPANTLRGHSRLRDTTP
jgi:2,3-bisphosphoglycerate-dependent phosphoglycerate mutase